MGMSVKSTRLLAVPAVVAGPELEPDDALKLLDDLAALGTRWLTLSGGEPLLRRDIGALIARALEKRLHVRLSTNGILVPKKLDELKGRREETLE